MIQDDDYWNMIQDDEKLTHRRDTYNSVVDEMDSLALMDGLVLMDSLVDEMDSLVDEMDSLALMDGLV